MSIVLKKGNFKKPEDRRWLFECGYCHADFLIKSEDLHPVETDDRDYYSYLVCPVCGGKSHALDEDWIKEGYIREAKLIEPTYANKVTITDYDSVEYTYSLESEKDVYKLAEYIPGFKFPVKKVPYEE